MPLFLGIDLGTSYFKAALFDETGELRGLGRTATGLVSPVSGRVELPVDLFWERLRKVIRQALVMASAEATQIAGVSYSSQANTFLLLDASGSALTPLVIWTDQRAAPLDPDQVAFGNTQEHGRVTGMLGMVPERAPAKVRWFARREPRLWAQTRWVMTLSDYLTFALTGTRHGDASTASLTGLYNLQEKKWWPDALATFGIDPDQLSTPLPPASPVGRTWPQALSRLGLPAGIPVAVGALDHQAAAIGAGLGTLADASLSTGTVLAAVVIVDRLIPMPRCIHLPHTDGRHYYRLAFDPEGAGQVETYQREHAPGLAIEQLLTLAERAAVGKESDRSGHGAAVLSMLERIAQTQRELLQHVAGQRPIAAIAATGGGARSAFWLQLTANIVGRRVRAVAAPERACLGAAMFAAVASGTWRDLDEAAQQMVKQPRDFLPFEPA